MFGPGEDFAPAKSEEDANFEKLFPLVCLWMLQLLRTLKLELWIEYNAARRKLSPPAIINDAIFQLAICTHDEIVAAQSEYGVIKTVWQN